MSLDPLVYDHAYIRGILERVKRIAMVGASANDMRPSYFAMLYLQNKGLLIDPVNPRYAGRKILGRTVYGSLGTCPRLPHGGCLQKIRGRAAIAEAAIAIGPRSCGCSSAAQRPGGRAGQGRRPRRRHGPLPKIEHGRLFGEIGWLGVNRGVLTSRKGEAIQLRKKKGSLI